MDSNTRIRRRRRRRRTHRSGGEWAGRRRQSSLFKMNQTADKEASLDWRASWDYQALWAPTLCPRHFQVQRGKAAEFTLQNNLNNTQRGWSELAREVGISAYYGVESSARHRNEEREARRVAHHTANRPQTNRLVCVVC